MYGYKLEKIFEEMQSIGLCESEREFGRFVGKSPCYLRNHRRCNGRARVSPDVIACLRYRLKEISKLVPSGVKRDLVAIVETIDENARVMAMLA